MELMDESWCPAQRDTLCPIHPLHTGTASPTLWMSACLCMQYLYVSSVWAVDFSKLGINLVCDFVHILLFVIKCSAFCHLSYLHFLCHSMFWCYLQLPYPWSTTVIFQICPNDFLAHVFSSLDFIYGLVNRNFRSFHSLVFRVTSFIKGITTLKDSCKGTLVYS